MSIIFCQRSWRACGSVSSNWRPTTSPKGQGEWTLKQQEREPRFHWSSSWTWLKTLEVTSMQLMTGLSNISWFASNWSRSSTRSLSTMATVSIAASNSRRCLLLLVSRCELRYTIRYSHGYRAGLQWWHSEWIPTKFSSRPWQWGRTSKRQRTMGTAE